jgi:hypothetical protein
VLTVEEVERQVMRAISALNRTKNGGGIVALDELRRELPQVPRDFLDATLLDMERREIVILKASKALRAQRAEHAIRTDRGLLFFVICRGPC